MISELRTFAKAEGRKKRTKEKQHKERTIERKREIINNERKQLTDHSTFIGFAPIDNPQIAISVFIENGYWGSRWAAPIASLIIEKYINGEVNRKWLEQRMINGSLLKEYEKPYKFEIFEINE